MKNEKAKTKKKIGKEKKSQKSIKKKMKIFGKKKITKHFLKKEDHFSENMNDGGKKFGRRKKKKKVPNLAEIRFCDFRQENLCQISTFKFTCQKNVTKFFDVEFILKAK